MNCGSSKNVKINKENNILFNTDTALPHYLPSYNILLNNMF